tara:strand:+ start:219 stop:779 length:561 start_codon:yes stop_codon:yes gene_type:complete
MKQILIFILLLISVLCYGNKTKVIRIIDGDTFETETGEKVRLIGINTPEISDFYGLEAKEYLKNLVENKVVDLQTDNISSDRDRYQRLLRYVIINGIDLNKKMVADGFAFAYLKYKFSKSDLYEAAQIRAREKNLGIWGNSQNESSKSKQFDESQVFWKTISPKFYFIISVIVILFLYGLYACFKK